MHPVVENVLAAILSGEVIRLPRPSSYQFRGETALQAFETEPNKFGGQIGPYWFQFEGEDDLLHVFVLRIDRGPLTAEEGQNVMRQLLPEVAPGLVWLKPGTLTQHFYFGHDILVESPGSP